MAGGKSKRKRRAREKQRRHELLGEDRATESSVPAEEPAVTPARKRRSRDPSDGPPAPWGDFPLVEIVVLIGLVMLIGGLFFVEGERGILMVGVGLALAALAGLELSVREHFAGYRSHTLVLAAVPATITVGVLFFFVDSLSPLIRAAAGLAVGGLAAWGLTRAFQSRSGGYAFRVTRPR